MARILRKFGLLCEPVEVNAGQYGGSSDPNAGTPLEGAVRTAPTDVGGVVQHGQDANASALQEVGWLNNKLFRKIMDYHVSKYPFYTALFTKATQMQWKGHKEAEYPEIGDIKDEARTLAQFGGSTSNTTVTLTSTQIAQNDLRIFQTSYTIIVHGVKGYEPGEASTPCEENLMLYVTDRTNSSVTVMAVNGPAVSSGSKNTYVPTIPAGTLLKLAAPALAEEEVEVASINPIPTPKNAYLQKKGYSVQITDFFNEAVKDIDWEKDRIKRQALDAYKKLYTTTALFGAKRKFYKVNENGTRICYTQEGILNQVRMAFQTDKWTKGVLISIAKMLFTTYTDADEIEVFCGSDVIEGLLNIDWGTGVSQITYLKDKDYNVDIASFRCTFGTLHFTHELALTHNHLEKCAVAIPMNDAIRIFRDNGTTKKADGNKGEGGKVQELTKEFFIQDDCFIVNALNSMIIGPAEVFTQGFTGGVKEKFIATESLTGLNVAANLGKIYYLTKVDGANQAGLYKVVNTGTTESPTYAFENYSLDKTRA